MQGLGGVFVTAITKCRALALAPVTKFLKFFVHVYVQGSDHKRDMRRGGRGAWPALSRRHSHYVSQHLRIGLIGLIAQYAGRLGIVCIECT